MGYSENIKSYLNANFIVIILYNEEETASSMTQMKKESWFK